MQAASNRARSSSDRYRSLPLDSLGFFTSGMGFCSLAIHFHSFTAWVYTVESAARYRTTVDWLRFLCVPIAFMVPSACFSLRTVTTGSLSRRSRCSTMVAEEISESNLTPMRSFHHSNCALVIAACFSFEGRATLMYRSTISPRVCFLASVARKWRPSLIPDSVSCAQRFAFVRLVNVALSDL